MDENVPNVAAFLARYVHPQKLLPPLPGVRAGLEAQVFGLSTSGYDALLAPIGARTKRAAATLLDDPESARILERLGQRPTTLVGLGDSLIDDANSWLEILRAANDQIGGQLKIVNAGVSGETTVQMLARMPEVMSAGARHRRLPGRDERRPSLRSPARAADVGWSLDRGAPEASPFRCAAVGLRVAMGHAGGNRCGGRRGALVLEGA